MSVLRPQIWLRQLLRDHDKKLARGSPVVAIVLLGGWFIAYFIFHLGHPPVGTYIGILAFVAGIVAIWLPDTSLAKFLWFVVLGGLLYLEVTTLYQQKHEDEQQQSENQKKENNRFADLRRQEDDRFATVLKSQQDNFAKVLEQNQKEFLANLGQMKRNNQVSTENLAEVTGGDSVCYLDLSGSPTSKTVLIVRLAQKGRYPISDIHASVVDLDAFNSTPQTGTSADVGIGRHVYPVVSFLGRWPFFDPVGTLPIRTNETLKHYNAWIMARNGAFTELIRIKREAAGGYAIATLLIANYYSGPQDVVVMNTAKETNFPESDLAADDEWQKFSRKPVWHIKE